MKWDNLHTLALESYEMNSSALPGLLTRLQSVVIFRFCIIANEDQRQIPAPPEGCTFPKLEAFMLTDEERNTDSDATVVSQITAPLMQVLDLQRSSSRILLPFISRSGCHIQYLTIRDLTESETFPDALTELPALRLLPLLSGLQPDAFLAIIQQLGHTMKPQDSHRV